jgi:ATP-dependent helicase/nuclease subunit B
VHATFLLGAAGTGKTHRCLEEVRNALKCSAEGLPLLFLAPRQATYQIERELLSDSELHGYTRVQVLSFDRLARFILSSAGATPVLSIEGRVMVLRALLTRHHGDLKVFQRSARLPGFARQLSDCITELQHYGITAAMLLGTRQELGHNPQLANKLHDLALIYQAYGEWLEHECLHDTGSLLSLAADVVRSEVQRGKFRWEALWLDSLAELTPQEMDLLVAILSGCERATLAFCADSVEAQQRDWLSAWSVAGSTAAKCCAAVRALPECSVEVEELPRGKKDTRFFNAPALAHIESAWESPLASVLSAEEVKRSLRVVSCANPEEEIALAAQEILRHVRNGGRFRDCGVILRDLSGYHDAIRRVFRRYEIPFFIDRREQVSHHPLPELTRSALRLAAFDWQLDDWLCVLKTGLLTEEESEIDRLENEALERGWSGKTWQQPFPTEALERSRKKLVPPLTRFTAALRRNESGPTGREMADALAQLWSELKVTETLEDWSRGDETERGAVHGTVWEQMEQWVADLALAFAEQRLDLREWIAVVDAGFSGFTVGVVPPALDQVVVGTVNRSRHPNLELAIVPGLNETVFPAPLAPPILLNLSDREALENQRLFLGGPSRARLGHERYYGYIACTRARRRLVLSYSAFDAMDRKLNPSIFISRVQQMFPTLEVEAWQPPETWLDAEHTADLLPALLAQNVELPAVGVLEPLRDRLASLRALSMIDALSPAATERLYGRELRTSITSLERFGECPFKFLVHSGLRAQERKVFQIDRRKLGDFQHRVLKEFHEQLKAEKKRWREITPAEASQRIARISEEQARTYNHGLFATSASQRFALRQLSLALQDFIEVIVGWMEQYAFDPEAAELQFSGTGDVPAWRMELDGDRSLFITGSIDRVDLLKQNDGTALCVVLDFKSSARKIEPVLLHNGVQMQLPGYLTMLRRLDNARERFGVSKLTPAGLFYVSLRGSYESGGHRNQVLVERTAARRQAYRHAGRFDVTALDLLDSRKAADQFNYSFKKDGGLDSRSKDPMDPAEFVEFLDGVEARLRNFGQRIFAGEAAVTPYRRGSETPCAFCEYRPICRIDPWTHQYRTLETPRAT